MTSFEIAFDEARGVLIVRLPRGATDREFNIFCNDLRDAVKVARRKGPLRYMSHNRGGKALDQGRAQKMWLILVENNNPADRMAVLVSNSLEKVATRKHAKNGVEAFVSENAALTWLSAGR